MAVNKESLPEVAELKKQIGDLSNENKFLKSKIRELENSIGA